METGDVHPAAAAREKAPARQKQRAAAAAGREGHEDKPNGACDAGGERGHLGRTYSMMRNTQCNTLFDAVRNGMLVWCTFVLHLGARVVEHLAPQKPEADVGRKTER